MRMITTALQMDELTLRSNSDEINDQLEAKLNDRLSMAGIEVIEPASTTCLRAGNCSRDVAAPTGRCDHLGS